MTTLRRRVKRVPRSPQFNFCGLLFTFFFDWRSASHARPAIIRALRAFDALLLTSPMSSSQLFIPSSPISSSAGHLRKSKFTFRHLSQLALSSTACPLRVIAHIDLDAFYAQCEGVRLGIAEDQPLAVQVMGRGPSSASQTLIFCLAMARTYCHQLSCTEIWLVKIHRHLRSEEAMSEYHPPACGYMERGRCEVGLS